jgi:pyrimidine deaminase RibD-like protein
MSRKFMQMAVEEMLNSRSEHKDKSDPLVGAVLVSSGGDVLGTAHRGALRVGDHAEYTLIERVLQDTNLEGSSLFVTLEPCVTRGALKTPCAERIIQARIGKVIIGMPDPNPQITGHGIRCLQENGVVLNFFDFDFFQQEPCPGIYPGVYPGIYPGVIAATTTAIATAARSQHSIRMYNETPSVAAMRVSDPDRAPARIQGAETQPQLHPVLLRL